MKQVEGIADCPNESEWTEGQEFAPSALLKGCQEQYAPKDGGRNVDVGVGKIVGSPTPAYEYAKRQNEEVSEPLALDEPLKFRLIQRFECSNEGSDSEDAQVPQGAVPWKFVKVIDDECGEDDGCEESDRIASL